MPEEFLPKPRLQMPSHSDGGQAQTDLPLPEKELPANASTSKIKQTSVLKSKFFWGFIGISFLIAFIIGGIVLGRNGF